MLNKFNLIQVSLMYLYNENCNWEYIEKINLYLNNEIEYSLVFEIENEIINLKNYYKNKNLIFEFVEIEEFEIKENNILCLVLKNNLNLAIKFNENETLNFFVEKIEFYKSLKFNINLKNLLFIQNKLLENKIIFNNLITFWIKNNKLIDILNLVENSGNKEITEIVILIFKKLDCSVINIFFNKNNFENFLNCIKIYCCYNLNLKINFEEIENYKFNNLLQIKKIDIIKYIDFKFKLSFLFKKFFYKIKDEEFIKKYKKMENYLNEKIILYIFKEIDFNIIFFDLLKNDISNAYNVFNEIIELILISNLKNKNDFFYKLFTNNFFNQINKILIEIVRFLKNKNYDKEIWENIYSKQFEIINQIFKIGFKIKINLFGYMLNNSLIKNLIEVYKLKKCLFKNFIIESLICYYYSSSELEENLLKDLFEFLIFISNYLLKNNIFGYSFKVNYVIEIILKNNLNIKDDFKIKYKNKNLENNFIILNKIINDNQNWRNKENFIIFLKSFKILLKYNDNKFINLIKINNITKYLFPQMKKILLYKNINYPILKKIIFYISKNINLEAEYLEIKEYITNNKINYN